MQHNIKVAGKTEDGESSETEESEGDRDAINQPTQKKSVFQSPSGPRIRSQGRNLALRAS